MNDKQNYLFFSGIISIIGVIILFASRSTPKKSSRQNSAELDFDNSNMENQTSTPDSETKDLLNQLSTLYDLKEKNVITEQIYEQEKNQILSKFPKQKTTELEITNIEPINVYQENYDPTYEELFTKPKWHYHGKYWIGFFTIFLAGIVIWFMIPKGDDLTQEEIISQLNTYCITEFENDKKTKGTFLFEDRKYIDSFYSRVIKGDDGETNLEFYPRYSGYTTAWEVENAYKLQQCISTYTFQFDTTKLNNDNRFTKSKISKFDINNDGKFDYIVDGYFQDCSGGSGGEGKYFLTFINSAEKFKLIDVLITLPLEYTISRNKLVVKGQYKSWFNESIYNFDKVKNKWIYSKSESKSYSY
ncbi:MAG: hypothetical protein ACOYVG_05890 [Bacteroidota bacterium]